MKDILLSIKNRLSNKGTILGLVSLIISLIMQFGIEVDSTKVMAIVESICSILLVLGLLNNPVDTKEMYIPGVSDKLVEKKVVEEVTPAEEAKEVIEEVK